MFVSLLKTFFLFLLNIFYKAVFVLCLLASSFFLHFLNCSISFVLTCADSELIVSSEDISNQRSDQEIESGTIFVFGNHLS